VTDTTIVYQDAFIFLFIFIMIWILYSFDYPILEKLSDINIRRFLQKIPLFKERLPSEHDLMAERDGGLTSSLNSSDYADISYDSLLMMMRRIGFALVLLFCLPAETVHMFKSNAQYYWSILAFSIAIYQCIKLLVFEQLEQFSENRFIYKWIRRSRKEQRYERELITLVIVCSVFWVALIYVWS
jgi:hypothetical protein